MVIGGFQKLTLIDFPGKIAATIFVAGCNFRCFFCHNPELVEIKKSNFHSFTPQDVLDFLDKRKNRLEGICITGGEPTLYFDLFDFISQIKVRGFLVKLDTNGTNPFILEKLIQQKRLDYVAMDVKNSPQNYSTTCGVVVDLSKIEQSIKLLKNSSLQYEFRTTVVPGFHTEGDFIEIGRWLRGSKKYVLQEFKNQGKLLKENFFKELENKKQQKSKDNLNLEKIKELLKKYFEKVEIRRNN